MTERERAACERLSGQARARALEAFEALDRLAGEIDSFVADVHALAREADGLPVADDLDAEWADFQRQSFP
jgi:hypothetical protein